MDVPFAISLCARQERVDGAAFSLKQQRCPRCGKIETLNRHGVLRGNDPVQASGQCVRGQRVFCSNRGQRGGCGRTFSVFLADVLPRYTLTASLAWQWLVKLLAGLSLKAAAEKARLPFALETMYRLRGRLLQNLSGLRTRLARHCAAPAAQSAEPLLQTMTHLQRAFPQSHCPLIDFQLHFQRPLLG